MSTAGSSNALASLNAAQYQAIGTSTTTVVFKGQGIFYGVQVINAGTSWTITVYDNIAASGNQLSPSALAITLGAPILGIPQDIGIWCALGLTIVTAGATPGVLNVLFQPI